MIRVEFTQGVLVGITNTPRDHTQGMTIATVANPHSTAVVASDGYHKFGDLRVDEDVARRYAGRRVRVILEILED